MTQRQARENAAANAVCSQLAHEAGIVVTPRRWDDGNVDGMHDFYLDGDGQTIALEVTTLADGARVGRDHRWEREAPDGWIKVEGLTGTWIVAHEGDAEAANVVQALRSHLPRLAGVVASTVDTRSWQEHLYSSPETRRANGADHLRALNRVGIILVNPVVDASPELLEERGGEVWVQRGFGTERPADRNLPVSVVDEQLRDGGPHHSDVLKLRRATGATARRLWMWVEVTEGLAMLMSFDAEGLPDAELDIEGIDAVWLGTAPASDTVAGYRWLRGSGWANFSVDRENALPT